MKNWAILTFLLPLLGGCSVERHYLSNTGQNQTIRVESGDRLYLEMDENATTGYRWGFACDDPDVEVKLRHVPAEAKDGLVGATGRAEAEIRVHRGYDGPTAIRFFYKRSWQKEPVKEFNITLFKRTGDCAFWE